MLAVLLPALIDARGQLSFAGSALPERRTTMVGGLSISAIPGHLNSLAFWSNLDVGVIGGERNCVEYERVGDR